MSASRREAPLRPAAMADRFYPGDPGALRDLLDSLAAESDTPEPRAAAMVVAPHAGFVYSGGVASTVFDAVEIPRHVVLIGPKHTRYGAPAAINLDGAWATPLGPVPVDPDLAAAIHAAVPGLVDDADAFAVEHCLEVELPFLRHRRPDVRIVPIVLAGRVDPADARALGHRLAEAIAGFGEPVLIVASSDMHHQGSDDLPRGADPVDEVHRRDALAMAPLEACDTAGLLEVCRRARITMCGVVPTAIAIEAARALGAGAPEPLAHTDSYAVAAARGMHPSRDWVVGYAGYRMPAG